MNRKEHMKADLFLLGYTNEAVHAIMDYAVRWLGAGHRSVYHSYNEIKYIKVAFGKKAGLIALMHVLIDNNILDKNFIKKEMKMCNR